VKLGAVVSASADEDAHDIGAVELLHAAMRLTMTTGPTIDERISRMRDSSAVACSRIALNNRAGRK
jgi:hypothetical protein